MMAIYLSKDKSATQILLEELENIPEKIKTILSQSTRIEELAEKYKDYENFLLLTTI